MTPHHCDGLSRARPRAKVAAAAAAAALVAVPTAGTPARADGVQSAQAQAAALRSQLGSLQQQADRAVEQYDLAQGELGRQVTTEVGLQRSLTDAHDTAALAGLVQGGRARALYQAGGMTGLYASVMDSGDITEAMRRGNTVTRILAGDRAAAHRADLAAAGVAAREKGAARSAAVTLRRTAQVQALSDRIQSLLARQQALVAAADTRVLTLVRAQQAAAAAAAAARFQADLAAAQARDQAEVAAARAAAAAAVPRAGSTRVEPLAPDVPAPSAVIDTVIAAAKQQLGKPYVWGAVGPDSFDCSGFTGYAYAAAGIALPRTAAQQYLTGAHPGLAQLLPGDLLFWATDTGNAASIDHMAMYLGNGMMIVAPHTGDVVRIAPVYADGYFGATRVDAAVSGSVPGPQWSDLGRVRGR